ncbi:MAG: hypothetical protein AAGJ28_00305 [Pseudomonadota bacterium]
MAVTAAMEIDGDIDNDGLPDVVIDADAASRVLSFSPASADTLTLRGLILQNGSTASDTGTQADGAGIRTTGAGRLELVDSQVNNNTTGFDGRGGGIAASNLLMLNSVVAGNSASYKGGGIWTAYGDATILASAVHGNTLTGAVTQGGGIAGSSFLRLTNSTVANNTGADYGGGLSLNGNFYVLNSTLTGNATPTLLAPNGSAIYIYGSTATTKLIANSLISANRGGGFDQITGTYTGFRDNVVSFSAFNYFEAVDSTYQGGQLSTPAGRNVPVALLKNVISNAALDTSRLNGLQESFQNVDVDGDGLFTSTIMTDALGQTRAVDIAGLGQAGYAVDAGAVELQADAPSLTVTTTADVFDLTDGETSLREAIEAINAGVFAEGSTIQFATGPGEAFENGGTITLSCTDLVLRKGLQINGDLDGDDVPDVVIDGNNASRVFQIRDGEITLQALEITGGNATGKGGGIYIGDADPALRLISSVVHGNTAGQGGGGLSIAQGATVYVGGSIIRDNTATGFDGGGIENEGQLTILGSALYGNSAVDGGGLINREEATVTNTTIANNTASDDGGGIYNLKNLRLLQNTISGNEAVNGGGLYAKPGGSFTLTLNNLILGNSAGPGGAPEIAGSVSGPSGVSGAVGDVFAAIDPVYGGGQLALNGHTVPRMALRADVSNPALDGGSDILLLEASTTTDFNGDGDTNDTLMVDARGQLRPVDIAGAPSGGSDTTDAGAFELQPEPASLVVTTTADTVDQFDGETSLREAIAAAATGAFPNAVITFANGTGEAFETGGTITLSGTQLSLTNSMTIDGDLDDDGVADITVDANGGSRVFRVTAADVEIDGLVITGGAAGLSNGGGITVSGDLLLTNSVVTGNTSGLSGAGIFVSGAGDLVLTGSTISNNTATSLGGGLQSFGSTTIYASAITGNEARNGGGIYSLGDTTVTNSTVANNTAAGSNGGGIAHLGINPSDKLTLIQSTLTGNQTTSSGNGGGLYIDPSSSGGVVLANALIVGNSAAGLDDEVFGTYSGNGLTSGTAADIFAAVDGTTGGGQLGVNGGNVQTALLRSNPSNPAIDAGVDSSLSESTLSLDVNGNGTTNDTITVDGRGAARTSDATGIIGNGANTVDLGAVELQQDVPSLLVNTNQDIVDPLDGLTSLREAIDYVNSGVIGGGPTVIARLNGLSSVNETNGYINNGSLSGSPTIEFDPNVFDGVGTNNTIYLDNADLSLRASMTIDGDLDNDGRPDITIDAGGGSRAFVVNGYRETIALTGLDIADGYSVNGGNIRTLTNSGTLLIEDSIIRDGMAGYRSGGIYAEAELRITNSVISENRAMGGDGGGIYAKDFLSIYSSTITENTVATIYNTSGGGVNASGQIYIINSTFEGNNAIVYGGGLYTSGDGAVINSTFTGNLAGTAGGLFASGPGQLNLVNSIILGNSSSPGSSIEAGGNYQSSFNLIGGAAVADVFDAVDGYTNGGQLALNGGTVPTVKLKIDPSNPALDAGNDSFLDEAFFSADLNNNHVANDLILLDGRGALRPVDAGGVSNVGAGDVDLGAYEAQVDPDNLIVTTTDDVVDYGDGLVSLREAILRVNDGTFAAGSTITFAAGAGEAFENGGVIRLDEALGALSVTGEMTIEGADAVTITGDTLNDDIDVSGSEVTDLLATLGSADAGSDGLDNDGDGQIDGSDTNGEALLDNNIQVFALGATADVTLDQLTITGGGVGGGIGAASGAKFTLTGSDVLGNYSAGSGGGINAVAGATALITETTIAGNVAAQNGGGLYNNGSLTMLSSTISGNVAQQGAGGGVYNGASATSRLTNVTIANNQAATLGGGVYAGGFPDGFIRLTNVTISGNSAGTNGGGLAAAGIGSASVSASIISGNTAPINADVDRSTTLLINRPILGSAPSELFNAIDGSTGGGVLADNGGPVQTIALKADRANPALDEAGRLLEESNQTGDLNGDGDQNDIIATDARGELRNVDLARIFSGFVDFGAFEMQSTPTPGPDLLSDTPGNDTLTSEGGNDLIVLGAGDDTAGGGDGDNDTVSYENLFLTLPDRNELGAIISLDKQGTPQGTQATGQDVLDGFENLTGSRGVDNLFGDAADNILRGLDR